MQTLIIIPARFASTRFPGKPLQKIGGKTMIQRVYEQARKSNGNEVIVATDNQEIFDHVLTFGKVVKTSADHVSGTDRCAEAAEIFKGDFHAVINLQGDEPFIRPEQINKLIALISFPETDIATLCKKIEDPRDISDPNVVKTVKTTQGFALYFSRFGIPFVRNTENPFRAEYYKHIGIYGFKSEVLSQLKSLSPSDLELSESLEQLRWLENGYRIRMAETDFQSPAIDTPSDLEKAALFLKQNF